MSDLELAAYLDRGLAIPERDRVEDHLTTCAECRKHVVEAQRLIERARRPRRFILSGTLVAAAAAFLLLAVPTLRFTPSRIQQPVTRSDATSPSLIAYGPAGDVKTGELRFVWGAANDAVSYRFTLSQTNGETVWSVSTLDTTIVLPASVILPIGVQYYWVADGLLRDGHTRSTGLHEFGLVK